MLTAGLGGTPPTPPGYVPPGLPDTAAGSVNIFRGRLVIVFGPTGTVSGIFVYQQGTTPGPGNTPIVAITNSTTDPYGNTVQPTIQVTGTGTLQVGSAPNPQVQLRTSSGVSGLVDFLLNNATFVDGVVVCGIVGGTFAALNMQGPGRSAAGHRDRCRIQLDSSDGASFGNILQVYADDGGSDHTYLFLDAGGVGITACQQLTAADPTITATATSPAVGETWKDMRPLSNSFIGTISGFLPPQYRKTADGTIQFAGYVRTPPTTGNYNNVAFTNILAAYRPPNVQPGRPQWCVTDVADGAATPKIVVKETGDVVFANLPTSLAQTNIGIFGSYPLGNTGLILS